MKAKTKRMLAGLLAFVMAFTLLPLSLFSGTLLVKGASDGKTYVLETSALTAFAAGAKADGDEEKCGTDNYFTAIYSAKTKIDSSSKTFDDDYASAQRINFGGVASTAKNAIKFTTENAAKIKVWWVEGGEDNRQMAIFGSDGSEISRTDLTLAKNATAISSFEVKEAGTYYIGSVVNNNYIFKVEVVEEAAAEPTIVTSVLETSALTAFAAGAKADGDEEKCGTDNYFTAIYSAKTKIDSSSKEFEDGYTSGQRINFGGVASTAKNAIKFTTLGTATVKVWWVEGGEDNRQIAILGSDGSEISRTNLTLAKNAVAISTFTLDNPGTYYLGSVINNNYIFKVEVVDVQGEAPQKPERKAWDEVSNPVMTNAEQKDGTIEASFEMVIGYDGADSVSIVMKNAAGEEVASLKSSAEGTSGSKVFTPTATGTYTFTAVAQREGEADKESDPVQCEFVLPLAAPLLSSATSVGAGSVSVVWGEVPEAEAYNVYANQQLVGTTSDLSYTATGLTVGEKYTFTVAAVRGQEIGEMSKGIDATVTADAQQVWGFSVYGSSTSTDSKNCGYSGSANDGKVSVWSLNGKGKVVPNSTDGVAFYYTAVPTNYNFTLRANVHVDEWTYSNGQEGFGLLATDRLGENGNATNIWNNSYMVGGNKIEYFWDAETESIAAVGRKYSMKLGIGTIEKLGVTADNLSKFEVNDTATVNECFKTTTYTLETSAAKKELEAGTYNIVANATKAQDGTIAEISDFVLEIQKNNTGYFTTYYDGNGNIISRQKCYDPAALNNIDSENVYVGFFASRNAKITATDIQFSTILASEDAPAEARPTTLVEPTLNFQSSKVANTENYTLSLMSNVAGTVNVTLNGEEIANGAAMEAAVAFTLDTVLTSKTKNKFVITFYPSAEQPTFDEYTFLANSDKIVINTDVNRNVLFGDRVNLYVSPKGSSMNTGSKENPLNIYTAVKYAQPGQTIVVMEGTYKLSETVKVDRGINGTADQMIRMVADPEASSRPVFDFQGLCAGMILAGDYWYFSGFDCTNSMNGQKGIQVSGSNNVLDQVNAYHNGNTGIQLSRLLSTDLFPDWPENNLILNCTSYGNADAGYEDADGFAAKLTIGNGNVFDGCLAYNNADDGWDLFAKVETGSIGSVTIQNSVAYGNGYLEDGTNAGNGNGFKMGGDSLSGYHVLKNSYAFFNKAKGIDSNSCPDIQAFNSISYNNESYNVAFYTNNAANTDYAAEGLISFKDSTIKKGLTTGEQHKPKGTQDTSKYLGNSNYYWDGSKSVNAAGEEVTADWFKTLEFTGVTRKADGTLDLHGFLELTDKVPDGIGATPTGTTSDIPNVAPETAVDPDESTGSAVVVTPSTTPETVIKATSDRDNYVPVSTFEELIKEGKTLVVDAVNAAGVVVATYTIDGTKISAAPTTDFELSVIEDVKNQGVVDVVKAAYNVDASLVDVIDFAYVGQLNGPVKVKLNLLSKKYATGAKLKLFYYNEKTRVLEDQNQVVEVAADNTAEFTITHCSYYVLLPADAAAVVPAQPADPTKDKAPATADATPIGLALCLAVISGIAFVETKKRRITE